MSAGAGALGAAACAFGVALPLAAVVSEVPAAGAPASATVLAPDVAVVVGGGAVVDGGGEKAAPAAPLTGGEAPPLAGAAAADAGAEVVDPAPDGGADAGAAVGVWVAADAPLAEPWPVLVDEPDAPPERTAAAGGCPPASCPPAVGAVDAGWLGEDAADVGVELVEEEFSGATPPNAELAGCDGPLVGSAAAGAALAVGDGAVADAATSRGGGETAAENLRRTGRGDDRHRGGGGDLRHKRG